MKSLLPLLLTLCLLSAASASETETQNANSALTKMKVGKSICVASFWGTIPGIYDAGLLTMVSSRNDLNSIYSGKYNEEPPNFGNVMNTYFTGLGLKVGGIGALAWGLTTDNQLGLLGVPMILAGIYYHYAAQRDLETETTNCAAMIRDGNAGRRPAFENPLASLRYSYPF